MYLQITSICNFSCAHCCFSHGGSSKGIHGEYSILEQALRWAANISNYNVCIGGGEPTNHPRFFDILSQALINFEEIYMVTNGSNTKTMFRLADILTGEPEFFENEVLCNTAGKLNVSLSQDQYHNAIDPRVVELWKRKSISIRKYGTVYANSGFLINELHRVTKHGRARRTYVYSEDKESCLCPGIFVKPDGKVKACGCPGGPIIADIFKNGYNTEYYKMLEQSDGEEKCYKWYKMNKDQRKDYL